MVEKSSKVGKISPSERKTPGSLGEGPFPPRRNLNPFSLSRTTQPARHAATAPNWWQGPGLESFGVHCCPRLPVISTCSGCVGAIVNATNPPFPPPPLVWQLTPTAGRSYLPKSACRPRRWFLSFQLALLRRVLMRTFVGQSGIRSLTSATVALAAVLLVPDSAEAACGDHVLTTSTPSAFPWKNPSPRPEHPPGGCSGPSCSQAPFQAPVTPPTSPSQVRAEAAMLTLLPPPADHFLTRWLPELLDGQPSHRGSDVFHPPRRS